MRTMRRRLGKGRDREALARASSLRINKRTEGPSGRANLDHLTRADVVSLQRTAGNSAVSGLLQRLPDTRKPESDYPSKLSDYFSGNFLTNHIRSVEVGERKGRESEKKKHKTGAIVSHERSAGGTGWRGGAQLRGKNTVIYDQNGTQMRMLMRALVLEQLQMPRPPPSYLEFETPAQVGSFPYETFQVEEGGYAVPIDKGKGKVHLGAELVAGEQYKINHLGGPA
jgi:hypothetical protein